MQRRWRCALNGHVAEFTANSIVTRSATSRLRGTFDALTRSITQRRARAVFAAIIMRRLCSSAPGIVFVAVIAAYRHQSARCESRRSGVHPYSRHSPCRSRTERDATDSGQWCRRRVRLWTSPRRLLTSGRLNARATARGSAVDFLSFRYRRTFADRRPVPRHARDRILPLSADRLRQDDAGQLDAVYDLDARRDPYRRIDRRVKRGALRQVFRMVLQSLAFQGRSRNIAYGRAGTRRRDRAAQRRRRGSLHRTLPENYERRSRGKASNLARAEASADNRPAPGRPAILILERGPHRVERAPRCSSSAQCGLCTPTPSDRAPAVTPERRPIRMERDGSSSGHASSCCGEGPYSRVPQPVTGAQPVLQTG